MELSNFPPEVLALILGGSDVSYLLLRLWKCGNRILNAKLAKSTTAVELRARFKVAYLFRPMPRMLLGLGHLRHLCIVSNASLAFKSSDLLSTLQHLPESLESLEIGSSDLHEALLLSSKGENSMPTQNLGNMFPRLTKLALWPFRSTHLGICLRLTLSQLAPLPPSLTSFHTSFLYISSLEVLTHHLPSSLIHLDATVELLSDSTSVNWSSHFPHLQTVGRIRLPTGDASLAWLPKTTTSVDFEDDGLTYPWTVEHFERLPHLKNITISQLDTKMDNWIAVLPQSLTRLEITIPIILRANDIACLPSSLSILIAYHPQPFFSSTFDWKDIQEEIAQRKSRDSIAHLWPSSLKHLHLNLSSPCNQQLALLPVSLESLKVSNEGYLRSNKEITIFPSQLIRIEIEDMNASLQISNSSQLPFYQFSSQLTTLSLWYWKVHWFHNLPHSLTSLSISSCCVDDSSTRFTIHNYDIFATLPCSLKYLTMNFVPFTRCASDVCFSTLANLVELTITEAEFPTAVLQNLPRRLKALNIRHPSKAVDASDIEFIPPLLVNYNDHGIWKRPVEKIARYWPLRSTAPQELAAPEKNRSTFRRLMIDRADAMMQEDC